MEIINILKEFVNLYESNQIPSWVAILSAILPIIISIILLYQNHIIYKRSEKVQKYIAKNNEEMQKDIYNKEVKIKRYDIIVNCYITFADSLSKIPISNMGLKDLFEKNEKNDKIIYDMVEERDKVILETGKIKLLLKNDTDFIKMILELEKNYTEIVNELSKSYIRNEDVDIDKILEKIHTYQELLNYNNYDKYFEKYLTFEEIK